MDLTTYAIPAFIALIALELFVSARAHVQDARGFERRDSWASLAMGLGSLVVGVFMRGQPWARFHSSSFWSITAVLLMRCIGLPLSATCWISMARPETCGT